MATKSKKQKTADLTGQTDPKAALDGAAFLKAAQPVLKLLDADLTARAKASPAVTQALHARHDAEKAARRTADSFIEWQERFISQVGAAWLLSCVFVRTLEDRGLLNQARIAGPGAADAQRLFFEMAPSLTERDYLLMVFRELSRFPAARDLFDTKHNPVWLLAPSAEAAKTLLALFRAPSVDAPAFRFGQADTRFLGDLYQDLDEGVRKRFALLQTPRFVESFILDRTLEPAIEKFGLDDTDLIDPTCGSGHFLLGAFDRLFDHRLRAEPGLDVREAARRALDKVCGSDINPYAIAIARFRLTLSFLEKTSFRRLADAPALPLHLVVADSLLHNPHLEQTSFGDLAGQSTKVWKGEEYALEDEHAARAVLHRKYAAVVGNPPYIAVEDAALRERYRQSYGRSTGGKYSLGVPFTERFFQLARTEGRVGMITTNSFMKREFGNKLIEEYLPTVNLDTVVNTSDADIPGHTTPTVLLFGSSEPPRGTDVVTVLAIRGERTTAQDPAQALVWRSIVEHIDQVGFENEFISVTRTPRASLAKHPWSLGGGGAVELKALLEERAQRSLRDAAECIGISCVTGEDEVYLLPSGAAERLRVGRTRPLVTGELVRDWHLIAAGDCVFPYSDDFEVCPADAARDALRYLWRFRSVISKRKRFGTPMLERGLTWYELQELYPDKLRTPLSIIFAFVATHNHFVLENGRKIFKQSAPIIKLHSNATEDDHYALIAYLNSSTACFWMKQVFYPKATTTGDISTEKGRPEANRYEFAATGLGDLPLPRLSSAVHARLAELAREAHNLAATRETVIDAAVHEAKATGAASPAATLFAHRDELQRRLVEIQDEIDETICRAFDLSADDTRWLLTDPNFRRPWAGRRGVFGHGAFSDEELLERSVRAALIAEIESIQREEKSPATRAGLLSELAAGTIGPSLHAAFGATTEMRLWFEGADLSPEAVPFLAAFRHTESGLLKLSEWERTWKLQRQTDAGANADAVPVPPKYDQKDFREPSYFRVRGKLDVPKEPFISYPGCESDEDGEPVYGWAGWNHEQQAKALATLYWNRKNDEGWDKERLVPMLAGLLELIFWLELWHSEKSDEYGGDSPANYYTGFLNGECQAFGLTHDDLRAWRPVKKTGAKKGGRKKVAAPTTDAASAVGGSTEAEE